MLFGRRLKDFESFESFESFEGFRLRVVALVSWGVGGGEGLTLDATYLGILIDPTYLSWYHGNCRWSAVLNPLGIRVARALR